MTSQSCKPDIVPEFHTLTKCLQTESKKENPLGIDNELLGRNRFSRLCTDEATEVRRALRRKYHYLGEGVHRVVFNLGPRCVLKVAKSLSGAHANLAEANAWKQVKATKKKDIIELFAPISSSGAHGEYLVMPKVETVSEDAPTSIQNYFSEAGDSLYVKLMNLGVACRDLHDGNIGKIKGRWVVIDYGFGVKCELPKRLPPRPRGWLR